MDETGLVDAKTPFFCNYYNKTDIDPTNIPNDGQRVDLHAFRTVSGLWSHVNDYQNPSQDPMDLFNPVEQPQYSCYNTTPVSNRTYPLFHPHYYRGGPYQNTFMEQNPEYPTSWAPQLENFPMYNIKSSQNSRMNNRQYGNSEGCENGLECDNRYAKLVDNRMYNSTSFSRECKKCTYSKFKNLGYPCQKVL